MEATTHPSRIRPSAAWHAQASEAHTTCSGQSHMRPNPLNPCCRQAHAQQALRHFRSPNCSIALSQSSPHHILSVLQANPPLSSPAANHHGLVRHLLGLLHVRHQLVSILHVAQVVDASQVGVLGAKLVQGRVLQAGGGRGGSGRQQLSLAWGGQPLSRLLRSSIHHAGRQQTAAQ